MKKRKVTLQEMQLMGIFERIEQPETVFHMTDRKNLDAILQDGKIKTMADYVAWFFPSIEDALLYADLSNAYNGRKYWDFVGRIHTAPPLIPADTAILKLHPRYSEPLLWYKESNADKITEANISRYGGGDIEEAKAKWRAFDNCRICHYGDMKFKPDYEIIAFPENPNLTNYGKKERRST